METYWLPPLWAVAMPAAWRPAEDHRANPSPDPAAGTGKPRLGSAEDPRRATALGFVVSEMTVARYLRRIQRRGDPGKRWLAFLRNHRQAIVAFDFFTVPTATSRVLYCFFGSEHGRRRIRHFNVTHHPSAEWVVQHSCERLFRRPVPIAMSSWIAIRSSTPTSSPL